MRRTATRRSSGTPQALVEVLRLLAIVFCAGIGYQVGEGVGSSENVLGPFNGVGVGVIVGSGVGYVLGGVLGRSTVTAADRAQLALREVSVESLVAGALGLVGGVLLGAGVAWPLFLIPTAAVAVPLFCFVIAVLGYIGFQIGASKRTGVLALFGDRAGLAPRTTPASVLPRVVDTSIAIDARVLDVVRAGFLHGELLVPGFVLGELQTLADSSDDLRRAKGRRGLDLLETLRREPGVQLEVLDVDVPGTTEVDAKLVRLCLDRDCSLLTLDTNLAKVASLAGVRVLNLHALALALRPPVAAGDEVTIGLLRAGKEAGQAVGYLDDGSMVVVERARTHVGSDVAVRVTSVLTTANGRLVFGRLADDETPEVGARAGGNSPASMPRRRPGDA